MHNVLSTCTCILYNHGKSCIRGQIAETGRILLVAAYRSTILVELAEALLLLAAGHVILLCTYVFGMFYTYLACLPACPTGLATLVESCTARKDTLPSAPVAAARIRTAPAAARIPSSSVAALSMYSERHLTVCKAIRLICYLCVM